MSKTDTTTLDAEPTQADESSAPDKKAPDKPTKPKPRNLNADELAALSLGVEAAVLTSDRPMSAARLAEALSSRHANTSDDNPSTSQPAYQSSHIKQAITQLNADYESTQRSFRIEEVASGYQFMTLPAYADVLDHLRKKKIDNKLSPAAIETLAIIAYKQPIIRQEIETIRGVACGEVLRSLLEKHLIKIVGRAEEIGRPMLYGTTKQFLEVFGLGSLKDLPKVEEFNAHAPQ